VLRVGGGDIGVLWDPDGIKHGSSPSPMGTLAKGCRNPDHGKSLSTGNFISHTESICQLDVVFEPPDSVLTKHVYFYMSFQDG
jgi:hypothetical protein